MIVQQESFTLEDALDFLGNLEKANSDIDASTSSDCPLDSAQELQMQQVSKMSVVMRPYE